MAPLAALQGVAALPAAAADTVCSPMTRAVHQNINPATTASLMTTSTTEVASAAKNHGFTQVRGPVFRASGAAAAGLVPIYRLYKDGNFILLPNLAGVDEFDLVQSSSGYQRQKIEFYASASPVACGVEVRRYFKGTKHRYSASAAEGQTLRTTGWRDEGAKFWVQSLSAPAPTQTVPVMSAAEKRAALVPGTYQPSGSTTGAMTGTALTPYNQGGADLVITQDGTVLENLEIYGDIKIRAKNVVIRNSVLHGGKNAPTNATGIIDATSSAVSGLVIQDSTIRPDQPHHFRDGIVGHDYTAKRNHISYTTDGLGIFNRPGGSPAANVVAEGNYIHTLTYFDWSPYHSDGTHNDGIQVQGGENIRIVGNNIDASSVAGAGSSNGPRVPHAGIGIMLQQNVAKLANVVVEKNWVDNGQTSINIANGKYANITVTVSQNRLGRNQLDFGGGSKYPIRIINRAASTVYGLNTNVWADTGALLTEGKYSGIRYNG